MRTHLQVRARSFLAAGLGSALFFLAAHARAADWYADPTVAAGGDGSQGKPFSTIASALTVMSRGDTLWLASGTFSEVVDVAKLPGTSGRTTIRALPSAKPVIDGTSGSSDAQFVVQTSVPDTTFQDLTVTGAVNGALGIQFYMADGGQVIDVTTTKMSSNAVTFYYSSQGLVNGCTLQGNIGGRKTTGTVVTNNEVYGSGAEGIGLYNGSTNCTIAHNVVHDNYSVNIYLDSISHSLVDGNLIYETDPGNDLDGIEFSDEMYSDLPAPTNSYNTVINNVIVGHEVGIAFWMSDRWPTDLQNQSGLRYDVIANNTLLDNGASVRWDASPAHVGTTIENNVVVYTGSAPMTYLLDGKSANGITLDHDLWFAPNLPQPFLWLGSQSDHAGYVTASGQGAGDVLVDARLVNGAVVPPATNAELTAGSPAIGAGVALAAVTDDYLGAARPAGSSDLGAFQYGAVAPADGGAGTGAPLSDAGSGGSTGGSNGSDGGGGSGGGGGTGAGTGTSAEAGASGGTSGSGGDSSGGCRAAPSGSSGMWMSAAIAVLAVVRRRKRRRS